MKRSGVTENAYVEEKMTADVRHAKTLCMVGIVMSIVCGVVDVIFDQMNHVDVWIGLLVSALLVRWFFGGLESIISLLCDNGEAISKIKIPETIIAQPAAEKKTEAKPITHDDPANWPKQEPVTTGIDVEAALRAAKEISRN